MTEDQLPGTIPAPFFLPKFHTIPGAAMTGFSKRFYSHVVACAFISVAAISIGCRSPYYADRGAGIGALAGAGAGAIIGDATGGNAGSGALIGAGLGALTGAAVGTEMDTLAAQNRAEIAAQMGRQVQAGAANIQEVIAMTRAGVDPRLIQNYVRTSGVVAPLAAADVIYLHEQGVSTNVIQVMQNPPAVAPTAIAARPPVIVEEHYYGPPPCVRPHFGYHHGYHARRPRGRTSFGFTISK
ncbi:MAG: glycine zipper domain-containing protein [Planctomycetota bacterium]